MSLARLRGVFPIVACPFRAADESIDYDSFRRTVAFMAAAGADGVTVNGVLGEANRLVDAERARLVEAAVAAAPSSRRFAVVAGVTHAGTTATVALARAAREAGASAVMVSPTHEPGHTPEDELVRLYAAVSEGCPGLALVLQDHPASSHVHFPPGVIERVAREVPAVAAVKAEAPPTLARIAALRRALDKERPRPRCAVLGGLGGLYAGFELEHGADGFMTGFAFPELLVAMRAAPTRARAFALYARFLPLIVLEQQPGVAARKHVYARRALLGDALVRHPGRALAPALAAAIDTQLARSFPGVDITRPIPPEYFERLVLDESSPADIPQGAPL